MHFLTPLKVLEKGLEFIGIDIGRQNGMSIKSKTKVFGAFYGSTPTDIAEMWFDLQSGEWTTLTPNENSPQGFKRYMIAHYYLWTYPKNSFIISRQFNICERYCRGKELHSWIDKIACLYDKKIKWDESIADPETTEFGFSLDCVDVRVWEKRHDHHFNINRKLFSQKFAHAGIKYEIVMSLSASKCMQVVGPKPASFHDTKMFRLKTKEKLIYLRRFGKNVMGIADGIYKPGSKPEERDEAGMMALPSTVDSDELHSFKSRIRARQETFNGRIKNFAFLQYTYRGTDYNKHGRAFRAICVIVQYQMDNGSPLFLVD